MYQFGGGPYPHEHWVITPTAIAELDELPDFMECFDAIDGSENHSGFQDGSVHPGFVRKLFLLNNLLVPRPSVSVFMPLLHA